MLPFRGGTSRSKPLDSNIHGKEAGVELEKGGQGRESVIHIVGITFEARVFFKESQGNFPSGSVAVFGDD